MNYKILGKTDLKISEISFGCMSLGDNQKENDHMIGYAIDHGVNFFDTADLYQKGFNEETVGKALKDRRDEVMVCTKVGNVWDPDGQGWHWDPSKKHILKSVEGSLSRLQTDCIDLYLLHGGTIEDPIDETIEAFESLKQAGKIKHYGISSIRPNVIREYIKRSAIACVMMQYSLLDRRPEEAILELLKSNQIGVLVRGSLAKGLLAGKPAAAYLDHQVEAIQKIQDNLVKTASSPQHVFEVALQYVLKAPAVTSAVVGIRTIEQLKQILSFNPGGSGQGLEMLQAVLPPSLYTNHR